MQRPPEQRSLGGLVRYFLRLGSLGFGGPIALVGYMQRDLVERNRWVGRDDFLDGVALGQTIVEERLAACVNLLPIMESVYRWEGRVEHESERQVVIKTARERVVALWERVREMHPYEVPEFVVIPIVDGNDAYLRWAVKRRPS